MTFRILSDLHCDFADFNLPHLDTDKDDVLILAGDIGVIETPSSFDCMKDWATNYGFKKVIHLNGNHEFYGGSILRAPNKLKERFKDIPNVHVAVNNEVIRVDNVSYICATLWTNYNGGNPIIMQTVRGALNDYKYIRTGNYGDPYLRRINPHDLFNEHMISKDFIFNAIKDEKNIDGQKIVVVTHHGPSTKSIHPKYFGDPVNWGYVSDLEQQIIDAQPNFWLHGHIHSSMDYMIEKTRIIASPRGYARRIYRNGQPTNEYSNENEEFNPTLRIVV